jgi:hypothetical protein
METCARPLSLSVRLAMAAGLAARSVMEGISLSRRGGGDGRPVMFSEFFRAGDADVQVMQEPVIKTINPAVHAEVLAALPGVVDHCRLADVLDLLDDVQLTEPLEFFRPVKLRQMRFMLLRDILYVAQPVINQAVLLILHRRQHAAAAVVTADDDVLDLENLYGILNDGETVEVGMHDYVGDVAMDKHFARQQTRNLVGGNAAVRTADPEILGHLLV